MRAYKANMIPGGTTPVINVSQYDNDYAVTVTLIEGAEIYTPPVGATIRVEGTKPDGNGFEYPCTYQGNVVTMPIYTQMTAVAGRFPIELVVYQSGLRVGSCNIIFAVEKAPLGEDTDISETVIPDIIAGAQAQANAAAASATTASSAATNAVSARNAAIEAAQAAAQSAASLTVDTELSSTSTNPVQNKVIDATVTELKNETTELKSAFNSEMPDAQAGLISLESGTWRDGLYKYNDNSRVRTVFTIDISGLYQITVPSSYRFMVYSFTDDLTTALGTVSWTNSCLISSLPAGTKYIRLIFRLNPDVSDIRTYVETIKRDVQFIRKDTPSITDIKSDISSLTSQVQDAQNNQITLESGSWRDNIKFSDNSRIRTRYMIKTNNLYEITMPDGYYFMVFPFDSNKTALEYTSSWSTDLLISALPSGTKYIKMNFRKNPNESDIRSQIETFKDVLNLVTNDKKLINKIPNLEESCSNAVLSFTTAEFNSADFDTMNCGNGIILF